MKFINAIVGILYSAFFALVFGFGVAMFVEVNPMIPSGVIFAASFIPSSEGMVGALGAGIRREAFVADIKENLFANNPHTTVGINHSAFASDEAVNVPQAGANPNVEVNRTVLPATVQQRTDTNLRYLLEEFTTDPFLITNKDTHELNYNKRMSIMRQHINTLNDKIGDQAAFNYATDTAARQVITTGTASGDALAPGATGTRLALVKENIRKAAQILDSDNVPKSGRVAVLDTDMYWQLFDDETMINRKTIGEAKLPEGVVDRLFGFDIMTRSKVLRYDVGNAKKAPSAANAVDDNLGGLFFHPDSVSWAQNSIKVLIRDESMNPEWYGTIISAIVRYGSSICRTDEKGIVSLVQGS